MELNEFIKTELNPSLNETAFFMGNGLNNFCKTTSSWKSLLIDLAQKHVSNSDDFEKILDEKEITYPEFYDIIQLTTNQDYKLIKKEISIGLDKWIYLNTHKLWMDMFIKTDRPVLTTNYDLLLEKSNPDLIKFIKSNRSKKKSFRPLMTTKKGFTAIYPWHSYYSYKRINNSLGEFGIWHIHGISEYFQSIRLGLCDYMGIVERAVNWLRNIKRNNLNNDWIGNNSWVNILLNCNICFVGIDLGTQETSLRWLLIEREKYFKLNEDKRKKGWYILDKQNNMQFPEGKRLFLEKLGITIIEAEKTTDIYELMPKRIKKQVKKQGLK